MERLTERTAEGLPFYPRCFKRCEGNPGDACWECEEETEIVKKLAAYEDICPDPAIIAKQLEILKLYADCLKGVGLGRLGELATAEREGRLLEVPCKFGDTVYRVYDDCIFPGDCGTRQRCQGCDYRNVFVEPQAFCLSMLSQNGKLNPPYYLTRVAAEALRAELTKKEEPPNA